MHPLETRSKNKTIFKIIFIVFLVVILKTPLSWFISFLYTPVFSASNLIENYVSDAKNLVFKSKTQLINENKNLTNQNLNLELKLASVDKVFLENLELKRELFLQEKKDFYTARVVSSVNSSLYGSLLIYSKEELSLGSGVYIGEEILIGFVSEKNGDIYKVKLISSYNFQRDGVLKPSNIRVLIQGDGIGRYFINVPRSVDVSLGDVVEDTFGNLIGFVEKIDFDPTNPSKNIRFNIPYNLFQASFLNVEK